VKKLKSPYEMLSIKVVNNLFIRFQSNYGNKFSSQFPTEKILNAAKKEWAYALSPYEKNDIGYAIREMQKHYKQWPPTPGQFVELCRNRYKIMQVTNMPKVERSDRDVGNAAIRKMRRYL